MADELLRVFELQHSVVEHHLSRLRAKTTSPAEFRRHVRMLSTLLAAEATRDLTLSSIQVETPNEITTCGELAGRLAAVPILQSLPDG